MMVLKGLVMWIIWCVLNVLCTEYSRQVFATANRPMRCDASLPLCFTQMSTVSVIKWWQMTITSLSHWPST